MGRGLRKSRIFMSKFDQQAHIYRAFCIKKIKTKLHENSCPLQTRTHTPESDITYGPRVDVQHVRQLGHLVGRVWFVFEFTLLTSLGAAHKLIGNALPISAIVCKVILAMNLVHVGKIGCLCLLFKCLCAVFMVFRASIRQYILDLLPNRLCRLLQISAKHCRLVSVPPLTQSVEFKVSRY